MKSYPLLLLGVLLPLLSRAEGLSVRCGRLLDVTDGAYKQNVTVQMENGKITAVGAGTGVPTIDASNGVCLPGLIDVHTHLTSNPLYSGYRSLEFSYARRALMGAAAARKTLDAGFTTIRNVGAAGYADIALRDSVEAGEIDGPRMLVSGPAIGITGGHCDGNLLPPEFNYRSQGVADGPWPLRAKVRENAKYGATVTKICASGGVLSKGDEIGAEQLTLEEMQAIVIESHKLGRKVAAHAHGAQSIKDAIRAGVDSVEHCSLIDAEGIALAKQKGAYLVFDIYNDDYILSEGEKNGVLAESIEKERKLGQLQRDNFRKAWEGGARMAFGTDAGVYPHGSNAKQFHYMVQYGMKPIDAIRAATTQAADLLGWSGQVGVLAPGAMADLIVVSGDPLARIEALEQVQTVIKGGRVYKNEAPRSLH